MGIGQVESFNANVFVVSLDNAWTVSWESIEYDGTKHAINAQLTIYADGAFDLCWGDESHATFPIRAGIWYSVPYADSY